MESNKENRVIVYGKKQLISNEEYIIDFFNMIQPRTMLKVADNTGAKIIQCFRFWAVPKEDMANLAMLSSAR